MSGLELPNPDAYIRAAWEGATAKSAVCFECGERMDTNNMLHGSQFGADNRNGWILCVDCVGEDLEAIEAHTQSTQIKAQPCGRGWWSVIADGHDVGVISRVSECEYSAYISRIYPLDVWEMKPAETLGEAVAELRRVFIALDVEYDDVDGKWAATPHTCAGVKR